MEAEQSLIQPVKRLEKLIGNLRPVRELNTLSRDQSELMMSVRDNSTLARAQVEYSLADEDDAAARKGLELAMEQLEAVQEGLLAAGMYDLLDAADISQFTSLTSLCIDRTKRIVQS